MPAAHGRRPVLPHDLVTQAGPRHGLPSAPAARARAGSPAARVRRPSRLRRRASGGYPGAPRRRVRRRSRRRLPRWRPWRRLHGGGHRGHGGATRRRRGQARSDIRLKHDLVLIGRLSDGLGYYRFVYNGGHTAYVGVMAQEVQTVAPEAVTLGADGYLRVSYDLLGLPSRPTGNGSRRAPTCRTYNRSRIDGKRPSLVAPSRPAPGAGRMTTRPNPSQRAMT